MELTIKGHSGCDIQVAREGKEIVVYKSTCDLKYAPRLINQARKQQKAGEFEYQHIRVPVIFDVNQNDKGASIKIEYIYSKNFVEYFEHAGFEESRPLL